MQCEYYRNKGYLIAWDKGNHYECVKGKWQSMQFDKIITEPEDIPFLDLPAPDRVFTRAMDKKYQQNGNFKYRPGTYIMSALGCWHGKCSFCVEKGTEYVVRSPAKVAHEITKCWFEGYREVFDDSATFPTGQWLDNFVDRCRGSVRSMVKGCNMRFGTNPPFKTMKAVGFRMLLYGPGS